MQLYSIDGIAVPEGATSGLLKMDDGIQLRWARWAPTGNGIKGTVTLVQGRAEFIEKYFETIEELRSRGFFVLTYDLRGQGGSDRLLKNRHKGHVSSFQRYVDDLHAVLDNLALSDLPGPHYLLAHSTGAAIVMTANQRLRTKIDRAVLSSPFVELPMNPALLSMARAIAVGLVAVGMGGYYVPGGKNWQPDAYEGNVLTADRTRFERGQKYLAEFPDLQLGSPTLGWFWTVSRALKKFQKPNFGLDFALPSLVLTAGADKVVSSSATDALCRTAPVMGHIEIRGANHEILMERDPYREQFWAAFDAFIPGSA
ncbi:alpha/beta hydrolase [Pseudovibrio sp. SPO723]|uniref:alpha/beta hydrolase n=1 Tax=Nesiotobacter zosterae TaxID=392721 RepID=UPI0029C31B36|nr:alpha/beta hydrolase [Pseudovibrio sp. SPO723]MDX5594701.1 alpha/beta hydrolase [Pseudovibrio sp. SPO723]